MLAWPSTARLKPPGDKTRVALGARPLSAFDFRFEPSPFLFIHIVAIIKQVFYFHKHRGIPSY
jgi:hypothetical protein